MTSSFTISLDFELRWGIRDNPNADSYNDAILGARRAIPMMLDLFSRYRASATWATVGFLFAENRDELLGHLPFLKPAYRDSLLSPYDDVLNRLGQNEQADPLHFGMSLINRIRETPQQEIGTHSFSHFYCLEAGGDADAFADDLEAAVRIAQSRQIVVKSLVLPRNQLSTPHLDRARQAGIKTFRGNPQAYIYKARKRSEESLLVRASRLADSVTPLANTCATPQHDPAVGMINTPASRFLRPIKSISSPLAKAQRLRIMSEMTQAAKKDRNYHLWWHPHNFGRATCANIAHLEEILRHFRALRDRYGMQGKTMFELGQTLMEAEV